MFLKSCFSEICVKRICVNQGVGFNLCRMQNCLLIFGWNIEIMAMVGTRPQQKKVGWIPEHISPPCFWIEIGS